MPKNIHTARKILAKDNIIMEKKNCRMMKKQLRRYQQSRSLSRRHRIRRKHRNGKYKRPPETRAENTETKPQEQYYVTIQTREGIYEAGLIIDNTNNCPIQKNLTWPDTESLIRLD